VALTAGTIGAPGPALWLVLGAGGIAFGVYTASAFSLVLARGSAPRRTSE
jgi:hypothetical protein